MEAVPAQRPPVAAHFQLNHLRYLLGGGGKAAGAAQVDLLLHRGVRDGCSTLLLLLLLGHLHDHHADAAANANASTCSTARERKHVSRAVVL